MGLGSTKSTKYTNESRDDPFDHYLLTAPEIYDEPEPKTGSFQICTSIQAVTKPGKEYLL